jgi:Tfp pilus assembly protein PilX
VTDPQRGRGRVLIVVLIVQVVIATVFVVLVATNSLPVPGAVAAPASLLVD